MIRRFPKLELADEDGLLALGGDAEAESLLLAYKSGIFPWPWGEEFQIAWYAPKKRGVLFLEDFKLSKSSLRDIKRVGFEHRLSSDFQAVLNGCAKVKRKKQRGTWLTSELKEGILSLHQRGYALSFESWLEGRLVGGLYGIKIGSYLSAESMFHLVNHASKAALNFCVESLRSQGITWIDLQVLNPFTSAIGGQEISREEFMSLLKKSL